MARTILSFLAFFTVLLPAAGVQCWMDFENGVVLFPEPSPVRVGFPDAAPNRGYFLNYSHGMPADYHYRTWWVEPRPYDASYMTGMPGRGDSFYAGNGYGKHEEQRLAKAGEQANRLRQHVHVLVEQLLANSREDYGDGPSVTVNTFVNLNSLYVVSSLGRFLAEQTISELQQAGVQVIDVRKTPSILIRQNHGEYGLSRDMDELQYAHGAQFMVVGTYTYSQQQIFVNARLLRNSDAMVLSSASLTFGIDAMVGQMLWDEGFFVPAVEKAVEIRAFKE